MLSAGSRLLTGSSSGSLQLWSVDHSSSPPAVTMETSLEVDGSVFSAAFDNKMELVMCVCSAVVSKDEFHVSLCPGCGWYLDRYGVVHQLV